jgi:hypothetical protein
VVAQRQLPADLDEQLLAKFPLYHTVPRDPLENVAYRLDVLEWASQGHSNREDLWIACRRDALFYVNTFVWTYDPRRPSKAVPFITYEFQDWAIMELLDSVWEGYDLAIEKSRDMGASWLCVTALQWLCDFTEMFSALMLSRKEEYVDKSGDMKGLFQKIDFIHTHLPSWLRPNGERTKLHYRNPVTGSMIDGESTTGESGRGDRRTVVLHDEFAAVEDGHRVLFAARDTANTRWFNSTPQGTGNAFYDVVQKPEIRKVRLHWTLHPIKSVGLYYEGGKLRSPWYDKQCARAAHPQEIAQELDIDYLGSDFTFFDVVALDRARNEWVRDPRYVGNLEYSMPDCQPVEFVEDSNGIMSLWMHPAATGGPPKDARYVIGADIAMGTQDTSQRGSSNSCLSIADAQTAEKIAEVVASGIEPAEFAAITVATARWFNNALLLWEGNGPGGIFGTVVLRLGYRNIYYRRNEMTLSKRTTDMPGWWSTRDTKRLLLGEYNKALREKLFINRSYAAIDEARMYVFTSSGAVAHARSETTIDPSGARENHGDRVVADALCWLGLREYATEKTADQIEILPGSLAARRQKAEALQLAASYW